MRNERRGFVRSLLALAAASAIALPAAAQVPAKEFTPIDPPQPTDNPAKIEVIEFFSYGCPHCNDFNPLLQQWVAKLPADVAFKKVPVSFNAYFAMLAPMSYTLEAMGQLDKLDGEVFKAIHQRSVKLQEEKTRYDWAASVGLDPKKFADTYSSFGVNSKVKRAAAMTQAYRVQGVPALAIDGKYLVGGRDYNDMLVIADKLIAKVRAERSGKK